MTDETEPTVDPIPNPDQWWVRNKIDQWGNNLDSIERSCYENIERANVGLNYVKLRKSEQNYLSLVLSNQSNPDLLSDSRFDPAFQRLGGTLDYLCEESSLLAGGSIVFPLPGDVNQNFGVLMPSSDISSASAVYITRDLESQILEIEPSYKLAVQDELPISPSSAEDCFFRLRSDLSPFGEEFVMQLDGSRDALEGGLADGPSQAAHSMRDCFEFLIKKLAPSDQVRMQPWFKEENKAPEGVSRRMRLQYIYYKEGEIVEQSDMSQIDEQIKYALDGLNDCIKEAHLHGPAANKERVRNAIEHLQYLLLQVIIAYHEKIKSESSPL